MSRSKPEAQGEPVMLAHWARAPRAAGVTVVASKFWPVAKAEIMVARVMFLPECGRRKWLARVLRAGHVERPGGC